MESSTLRTTARISSSSGNCMAKCTASPSMSFGNSIGSPVMTIAERVDVNFCVSSRSAREMFAFERWGPMSLRR